MNREDLFEITRKEVHWLPECPCPECMAERERRASVKRGLPQSHVIVLSVEAAQLLGFIPPSDPRGSVARQLMRKAGTG